MTFPKGRIPLYLQLYWKLREDIILQEFTPGNRVPTITDLHERYGVSQGTVRQALELLEKEGLINLKAGSGIFVNEGITTLMWESITSPEEIQQSFLASDYELLEEGWIDVPNRIRRRYADQEDGLKNGQVYRLRFRMVNRFDEMKKQYVENFLPAWLMDHIDPEEIRTSWIQKVTATAPDQSFQSMIRPWICSYETGQLLGLPEGTPILRNVWTHFVEDSRIVSIAECYLTVNALIRTFSAET
jgi:DNA-binding GntR family transcriptional regulator